MGSEPAPDPLTTAGLFLGQASRLGIRPVVHHHRDGRWQDISWIGLREDARRVACGLVVAGVQTGDRVLLLAENRVEWLACDLGIQMAGGATVPLHPSASPETAQAAARSTGAVLAIASGEERAATLYLTDALGRIVRLEGEVARWLRAPIEEQPYREVTRRLLRLDPDDVATIVFAGVDAAAPRGLVLTHRACVETARRCVEAFGIGPGDAGLSLVSYADASERLWGILVPIAAGGTIWISRGARFLAADVHVARPTLMHCTPSVLEGIWRRVGEPGGRPSRVGRPVVRFAFAAARKGRVEGRAGRWPWLRLWLADRLALSSLRRRTGGGRLRFLTTAGDPLRPDVAEFFLTLGLPVHGGAGALGEHGFRSEP